MVALLGLEVPIKTSSNLFMNNNHWDITHD
jgi:hypothetical protein